nr:uncharacterized protein LOC116278467 [Vicugna pacos]
MVRPRASRLPAKRAARGRSPPPAAVPANCQSRVRSQPTNPAGDKGALGHPAWARLRQRWAETGKSPCPLLSSKAHLHRPVDVEHKLVAGERSADQGHCHLLSAGDVQPSLAWRQSRLHPTDVSWGPRPWTNTPSLIHLMPHKWGQFPQQHLPRGLGTVNILLRNWVWTLRHMWEVMSPQLLGGERISFQPWDATSLLAPMGAAFSSTLLGHCSWGEAAGAVAAW